MQTTPESSTETDIRHNSNDLSTKESEETVNMQTVPESSTETDIYNDSNDFSTKESSGKKEVNSGVLNGPPQTKKKTLVKMVDLGPNLDVMNLNLSLNLMVNQGLLLNIKYHCSKKLKNQKSVKH